MCSCAEFGEGVVEDDMLTNYLVRILNCALEDWRWVLRGVLG